MTAAPAIAGSRIDQLLVSPLAAGLSYADAAVYAGVSERTVKRRMAQPAFRRAVAEHQLHTAQQTSIELQQLTRVALATLRDLIGPGSTPSIQLGAARLVLEHALRWQESAEFEARLCELEQSIRDGDRGTDT